MRRSDGTRAGGWTTGIARVLVLLAFPILSRGAETSDDEGWPRSRASFGGRIESVVRRGEIAFLVEGQGISVSSLLDPARPERIARIEIPGVVDDFDLHGDLAIVAIEDLGVEIHDVSDPRRPRKLSFVDLPGSPIVVAWGEAGRMWVGAGYREPERYRAYSLSDPANPTFEFEVRPDDLPEGIGEAGPPSERWRNSYADGGATPPEFPFVEHGFEFRTRTDAGSVAGVYRSPSSVLGLAARGEHLLLACGRAGLWVVAQGPNAWPEVVATADLGIGVIDCEVAGGFAYLACEKSGLGIVDLLIPAYPVASVFDSEEGIGIVRTIRYEDGRLHATTDTPEWLLFDLVNPFRPSIVARVPLRSSPACATLRGNLLFLADDRLRVIDLADPSRPVEVGSLPPQYTIGNELDEHGFDAAALTFVGDGLVATGGGGWHFEKARIDVTDPRAPRLLQRIEDERFGPILHSSSGRLVMAWHRPSSGHRFHGVTVRDAGDPTLPIGGLERLHETPSDALAFEGRLWIAGGESGLIALSPWP